MNTDFEPGMNVSLAGENGVILGKTKQLGPAPQESYGFILWDTEAKNEIEDWCGMFGSFRQAGGKILDPDFEFTYLNKESDP